MSCGGWAKSDKYSPTTTCLLTCLCQLRLRLHARGHRGRLSARSSMRMTRVWKGYRAPRYRSRHPQLRTRYKPRSKVTPRRATRHLKQTASLGKSLILLEMYLSSRCLHNKNCSGKFVDFSSCSRYVPPCTAPPR